VYNLKKQHDWGVDELKFRPLVNLSILSVRPSQPSDESAAADKIGPRLHSAIPAKTFYKNCTNEYGIFDKLRGC